jgi:hypothetical protein
VSGAGITGGNPSWVSMPSQVRCNSTGEYVILGQWGAVSSLVFLSNYGHQLLFTPSIGTFGAISANPVISNLSDNTLILSASYLGRVSSNNYNIIKSVYRFVNNSLNIQNVPSTPIPPSTTTIFPWSGARNICMAQDRNQIVLVDTAGSGNVYVSTNGIQTAPWPESGGYSGISAPLDVINLSIPNVVSQTAVPRSAWSGVCVNYNDQFAFANKTGTVYLYTWTLQ